MRGFVAALLMAVASAMAAPAAASDVVPDGSAFDRAIVVEQTTEREGVAAEYVHLRRAYPGWRRVAQALVRHGRRSYDVLTIVSPDGQEREIYFDVTNFLGRM